MGFERFPTVAQGTSDIGMGEELQGLGGFTQYYNARRSAANADDTRHTSAGLMHTAR
ncbi:hypothetical protein YS110_12625 [Acidovorax sp. YS12]|nr:hypothetical protein YS110_12625 [Acidovorax sp. YS12]